MCDFLQLFFCYWLVVLFKCDLIIYKKLFRFFFYLKNFFDLECDLVWGQLYGLLRRMSVLYVLHWIFCIHLPGPLDLWCSLCSVCWLVVWMVYLKMRMGYDITHYYCLRIYISFMPPLVLGLWNGGHYRSTYMCVFSIYICIYICWTHIHICICIFKFLIFLMKFSMFLYVMALYIF